MTSEIVCAVISGVCTLVVCLLNNRAQQRKADEDQDKRMTEISHRHEMSMQQVEANISQKLALLDCKFDDLTKKVEKHNGLVERTYKLESDMSVMQEKQSVANHRIEDLEKHAQATP